MSVTIVIPTRNRGFILDHAVRSASRQTFRELDILISDNHSTDDTPEIARRWMAEDHRIRYVRTSEPLSMPASWEFALSNADADWILLLEDDGVLLADAVERAHATASAQRVYLVTFPFLNYYSDEPKLGYCRNSVVLDEFDSRTTEKSSGDVAQEIYGLRFGSHAPKMYNCLFARRLLERAREGGTGLCVAPAPDYGGGAVLLGLTSSYCHLDRPLMISNCGTTSPGASMEAYHRFQAELGAENKTVASYLPLPFVSVCNIVPETLGRARAAFPSLERFTVPIEAYLLYFGRQLDMFERAGWKLPIEHDMLARAVRALPRYMRRRIRLRRARERAVGAVDRTLRPQVWRNGLLRKTYEVASHRQVMRGEQAGFRDITGAARAVERAYRIRAEDL